LSSSSEYKSAPEAQRSALTFRNRPVRDLFPEAGRLQEAIKLFSRMYRKEIEKPGIHLHADCKIHTQAPD